MKCVVTLLGTLLLSLLRPESSRAADISVTIRTQLTSLSVGVPVSVDVTLTNLSPKPMSWRNPGDYLFAVIDSSGQQVGLTALGQKLYDFGTPHSSWFLYLKSGQTDTQTLTLSNIYDMSRPGRYTIHVVADRNELVSSNTLTITINSASRGDLNGDGVVDLNDLNLIQEALNTPSNRDPVSGKVNDARDLNGDGTIDASDAKVLASLCTYPRCASHR